MNGTRNRRLRPGLRVLGFLLIAAGLLGALWFGLFPLVDSWLYGGGAAVR